MNRKIILTATIGLAALTSACTPAQVKQFVAATHHKAPAVVAVDTPPVVIEIGTAQFPVGQPLCQTGPGPQCVPNPVVGDAVYVCGENNDPNIETVDCNVLPQQIDQSQVRDAPRLP